MANSSIALALVFALGASAVLSGCASILGFEDEYHDRGTLGAAGEGGATSGASVNSSGGTKDNDTGLAGAIATGGSLGSGGGSSGAGGLASGGRGSAGGNSGTSGSTYVEPGTENAGADGEVGGTSSAGGTSNTSASGGSSASAAAGAEPEGGAGGKSSELSGGTVGLGGGASHAGTAGGLESPGGAAGIGGADVTEATGGVDLQGGAPQSGGDAGKGGAQETGGLPTGGSSTGGTESTGGSPTGGTETTGGSSTGGTESTGGSSAGGTESTGGSPTGGAAASGGSSTGGSGCAESLSVVYVVPNGAGDKNGCDPANAVATIALALPKAADGGQVRVAGGTYSSQLSILLTRPVSLLGGYDPEFTQRDPTSYETTLIDTVTDPTIYVNGSAVTRSTMIDGFTIRNSSSEYTGSAIQCSADASPTIRHMRLFGSSASELSAGLMVNSSAAPVVEDSLLVGGDSSGSSWGADLDLNSGPVVFERNRAQGGNAPNSYGIEAGPGTIIRNNLLLGGPSSLQSKGAMVWTEAKLSNNTIAGGDANSSVGVQLLNAYTGKMSDVNNNIIFTLGSGTYRYCIYENSAFSDPMSLQGNLLFDCPALYDDENTTELTTIAGVNAMNGQSIMDGTCTSDCQTSRVNTNITTTLTLDELFQSPGGSDGQIETLEDNDWRLLTTDTKITRGGINTGTAACGANEALASCGEVLDDLLGTSARTVPYSIGAYEAP